MKHILVFYLLVGGLTSCAQQKQEDLEYRLTSYKFLHLISKGEFDSAKHMFMFVSDDTIGLNRQLTLVKHFLDEVKSVPGYDEFVLDSAALSYTKRREYTISIFKDKLKADSSSFVGEVIIRFKERISGKITTISAIAKPSKL